MNVFITALIIFPLILTGCATKRHTVPQAEVQSVVYKPLETPRTGRPVMPGPVSFSWPLRGQIISAFGDRSDDFRNKGIDIKAVEGEDVRAASDGRVVYCDSRMRGFGKTVILDHGNAYQTVYSYNSDILVKVGDTVRRSTVIAKAGSTGRAKEPSLHFEIRKDGEPVNPAVFLR